MRCAEFLMDHPTDIQSNCFDHMCEDLNAENIIKRIDQNIAILKFAKINVQKNAKPESIYQWLKSWRVPTYYSILTMHIGLLIAMSFALIINPKDTLPNPYTYSWLLLTL